MNRLRVLSIVAVALGVVGASSSATTADAATSRPAAPTLVRAYETAHGVRVTWANPTSAFDHVVVRVARGALAPVRTDQGRVVRVADRAHAATLTALAKNTRYAVTIWTRDKAGHFSKRAYTHFTTPAAAVTLGTISGSVIDSANKPLAGVRVAIDSLGALTAPGTLVRTDAHGRFAVKRAPGRYDLLFSGAQATGGSSDSTGYTSSFATATVRAGRTTTLTRLLPPGGVLSGRVVSAGNRPIPGVQVTALPVSAFAQVTTSGALFFSFNANAPVTTRADGTYTLRGLDDLAVRLCFSSAHSTQVGAGGYTDRCSDRTVVVGTRDTRHVEDTTLASAHGGALVVTVRRAGAGVVPGAYAEAYPVHPGPTDAFEPSDLQADAHGRARTTGLRPGRYQVCSFARFTAATSTATGYSDQCVVAVIKAGATTSLTLRLPVAAAISGVVRGPHGAPVSDVGVLLDGGHDASGYAVTDSRGHFTATGLTAGTYTVCAQSLSTATSATPHGTRAACYGTSTHVLATVGAIRTGIDVSAPTGAAVTGTVRSSDGHAAAGAEVSAESVSERDSTGDANADAAGRYTVAGLDSGKYRVCADAFYLSGADPTVCRTIAARVGHTVSAALQLPSTGSVTVRASEADETVPLVGVDAVLLKRCTSGFFDECAPFRSFSATTRVEVVASAPTFADGTVELEGIAPGHYAVCTLGYDAAAHTDDGPVAGYADSCSSGFDITVSAGSHQLVPTMTLQAGSGLSGRVTDAHGKPIAGVRVHVSAGGTRDATSDGNVPDPFQFLDPADAITAADGTYRVRSATPGNTTVCFVAAFAGTAKAGYLDQCIGGAAGKTNDGKVIVLATGNNAGIDQTLQSGPPRHGGAAAARAHARAARPVGATSRQVLVIHNGKPVAIARVAPVSR